MTLFTPDFVRTNATSWDSILNKCQDFFFLGGECITLDRSGDGTLVYVHEENRPYQDTVKKVISVAASILLIGGILVGLLVLAHRIFRHIPPNNNSPQESPQPAASLIVNSIAVATFPAQQSPAATPAGED